MGAARGGGPLFLVVGKGCLVKIPATVAVLQAILWKMELMLGLFGSYLDTIVYEPR